MLIYLQGRVNHSLVHFPDVHNSWAWARLKSRVETSHHYLPYELQEPKNLGHYLLSPRHISKRLDQKLKWGLHPRLSGMGYW